MAREDVADVRVREASAGRNDQILAETVVEHVASPGGPGNLRRVRAEAETAGVTQQVAKREVLAKVIGAVAQLRQLVGERRIELQVPIGGEDHGQRRREGLGDRADREGRISGDCVPCPMLQLADLDRHGLAAPPDGKLGSRHPVSLREVGERVAQGIGREDGARGRRECWIWRSPPETHAVEIPTEPRLNPWETSRN